MKHGFFYDGSTKDLNVVEKYGWSEPEDKFTWSEEKVARLVFEYDPNGIKSDDTVLNFDFEPYIIRPMAAQQTVAIYCNGRRCASRVLRFRETVSVKVDPEMLKKGRMEFEFDFPEAVSPVEVGESGDERLLGVKMFSLYLSE